MRGAKYSVPVRFAARRFDVRVGVETIEVFDGRTIVARHARSPKVEENVVLDDYLEVLALKPGPSREPHSPVPAPVEPSVPHTMRTGARPAIASVTAEARRC